MDPKEKHISKNNNTQSSADTVYLIGVRLPDDGHAAAEKARKTAAAVFERMDGVTQIVVLLHFYDDTGEETIARMLNSPVSAVRRLLLCAHASFEHALAAAGLGWSYKDMPQLIFEALDELIYASTVPPESVERVRSLLLENL